LIAAIAPLNRPQIEAQLSVKLDQLIFRWRLTYEDDCKAA
jgi:hypothetical protein